MRREGIFRFGIPIAVIVLVGGIGSFMRLNSHADSSTPIQHVVIIVEDDHSFDNYFGNFPGAAGTQWGVSEPEAPNPMPQGDPADGPRTIAAIDGGKMDDFDPLGNVQYQQNDIPTYWAYAQQYGLGEDFFADSPASGTPNLISMLTGQTGGDDETAPVSGCRSPLNQIVLDRNTSGIETYGSPCYGIKSIPQELNNAGLSWKMYGKSPAAEPVPYIKSIDDTPKYADAQIITDAQDGKLPDVSFVSPDNDANSDAMPEPTQAAQNFVANIVNTIMQGPQWNSTAIFVTWDGGGGWYDHVPPPAMDNTGFGPRVPLLVISPWAKKGYLSSRQGEFASFDKFIEQVFDLPSLGARDALPGTADLMDFFDFSDASNPPNTSLIEPMLVFASVLQVPKNAPIAVNGAESSSVTPDIGGPGTSFTYSVIYNSPTMPSVHDVIIDGQTYVMNTVLRLKRNQSEYQYATSLAPGSHSYSFQFDNGTAYRMPYNDTSYTGPDVAPFALSGVLVSTPGEVNGIGQLGAPLSIHVLYRSPSGRVPAIADVLIDGNSYALSRTSGGPVSGISYDFVTSSLPAGDHYFQFEFNDGIGSEIFDFQEFTFSVSPIILLDSSVSPPNGTTGTRFTFKTTYYGPLMPKQVDVVIDGKAHPLSFVDGNQADGADYSASFGLRAGSHSYAFYASDGTDAWTEPCSPGVLTGLEVSQAGSN